MFNFNLNIPKIIKENLPFFLQTPRRLSWIKALVYPINQIYQEFLVMYQVYIYKIRYNGQIIYLEKILNDKFSPNIGGIYITNGLANNPIYLYQKSEGKTPFYLYRNWLSSITYSVGNFAVENNKVYKSLTSNNNKKPSLNPLDWVYHATVPYLRKNLEYYIQFDFIVMVPSTITFNTISLRAIIDYYRLAGKRYKIIIY